MVTDFKHFNAHHVTFTFMCSTGMLCFSNLRVLGLVTISLCRNVQVGWYYRPLNEIHLPRRPRTARNTKSNAYSQVALLHNFKLVLQYLLERAKTSIVASSYNASDRNREFFELYAPNMKNGDTIREKSYLSVQYPRKLSVTALPLLRYVCMASSSFARRSPDKFFSLECSNYTQL